MAEREFITMGWINPSKNNPNVSLLSLKKAELLQATNKAKGDSVIVGFLHNATAKGYFSGEKRACPIRASKD